MDLCCCISHVWSHVLWAGHYTSMQRLNAATSDEQQNHKKFDDLRSAAKMGGESGPTGRAILFRQKETRCSLSKGGYFLMRTRSKIAGVPLVLWKQEINRQKNKGQIHIRNIALYWSLYWIQIHCTSSIEIILLPAASRLRSIWLKRLCSSPIPGAFASNRLITSMGSNPRNTSD